MDESYSKGAHTCPDESSSLKCLREAEIKSYEYDLVRVASAKSFD